MKWLAGSALLMLGACAAPAPAPAPADTAYTREPPVLAGNDTNVYHFEHAGPNSLGTLAVTAWPTAGPNAAPSGTLGGPAGQAKAEAAAAFYAENALCGGVPFLLASDATSQFDASRNSWTVFGRCTAA